jgi:hypothetical protein
MAIFAVAGVLPLIATIAISAQSPTATEELQMLQEQLRRAHVAGDAAAYLDDARRMHDFLNGSPASILQLMSAEAFAEHTEDALRSLTQFIRMSQSNEDVLKAKQFDALRESPQYSKIHEGMIANMASISAASKAFTLSHEGLIPEDIDYDRATKRFYISSVISKKIFAIDMNGRSTVFATSPDKWPMMALKVDEQRHLLWATEVAIDGFVFSPQKDWGRSAVLVYDLRSGKLRHRIEGPAHAALGDMTLTADGDVVVSDGDHGGIYRVSRTGETITRLDTGDFISPQTAAISADGLHLFVPDYLRGIGILDLKTKHVSWIPMEGRYALNGIDGLYLSGRTLIGTQNGASPERVIRFELDPSLSHVMSESIIERATPTLGDPTHGVIVGRDFYYIANSGWDALDDHGNVKPGRIMPEAIVMRARAF